MNGIHPLAKVSVRVLKNGVFENGKSVIAVAAIEHLWLVRLMINLTHAPTMATRHFTLTVASFYKVLNNRLLCRKLGLKLKEIHKLSLF
jgi:hypothetical protein